MSKCKYSDLYLPADDSFLVNKDPHLTPIRISLPKPPPLYLIDGWGKHPDEQRFEYVEVPKRLQNLYLDTLDILNERANRQSAFKVTLFKVQKLFWHRLNTMRDSYVDEITWIKKIWWHRLHGYWFFNHGKPTYICGWHFMYLNFWNFAENVRGNSKLPEYRDRDRRWFLFHQYIYTTRETFADYDESGNPVKVDGRYRMVDAGRRVFYGTINTKQRRAGETNKALCIGHELISLSEGSVGGLISYTRDNSEKHFRDKLVKSWQKFPIFFMPYYDGGTTPSNAITYRVPGTEVGESGINSVFNYAESGDGKAYDGSRLMFILCDEEGKTDEVNVLTRWYQLTDCMSTGNGTNIHGLAIHPSTIENIKNGENLANYRMLLEQSDFYERNPVTGRTTSGLCRFFIPADDGCEGFIDSYGMSVMGDEVLDYQKKEGFKYTATHYFKGERKQLLTNSDDGSIEKYKALCRKFPLEYSDSWITDEGGVGFNVLKIEKRISYLEQNRNLLPRRGNFVGTLENGFKFIDAPDGRFYVSMLLPDSMANQRMSVWQEDSLTGMPKQVFAPIIKNRFTLGADPIKETGKAKIKHKLSKGAGAVFYHLDKSIDPPGTPVDKMQTNRIVCTYSYRPAITEEYYKDMLAAAVYYGAMIYPEINVTGLWEYIENMGYGGYLKYAYDSGQKKIKEKPGVYTSPSNKPTLFNQFRDYMNLFIDNIYHIDLLEQARDIKSADYMTDYDLLTACIVAYDGSLNRINEVLDDGYVEVDLGGMRGLL